MSKGRFRAMIHAIIRAIICADSISEMPDIPIVVHTGTYVRAFLNQAAEDYPRKFTRKLTLKNYETYFRLVT